MEIVMVEAQFVELMVPLYSYGCGKKIKKALSHFKGIYSINVDHKQQKVTVWGICNRNEVLSTIRAKRKGARFWNQQQTHDHHHISSPSSSSSHRTSTGTSTSTISMRWIKMEATPNLLSLNWKATWKKVFNRSNL